jgi:hypothetical protein
LPINIKKENENDSYWKVFSKWDKRIWS